MDETWTHLKWSSEPKQAVPGMQWPHRPSSRALCSQGLREHGKTPESHIHQLYQADQLVRKGNGIRRTKTRFFSFCLLLLLSNSKLTCLLLWWHFRMWIIKKTQLKSQTTEMKPSRNASLFTLLIFCCCQLQTQSETVTTFTSIHALFHITSYRDCGKPSSTDLQFEAKQNLAAEMNGSDSWNMGFGSSSRSDPFSILAPTKQLTECHLMVKMFYSWTLEPNTVAEYIWKTNIRIIDKMLILSA